MKKIVILGSTGSIGRSTLEVVRRYPAEFRVVGLLAGNNHRLLAKQARDFSVRHIGIGNMAHYSALKRSLAGRNVYSGADAYEALPSLAEADIVVSAIAGVDGLLPTLRAVRSGKEVALANKESLVLAGSLIMPLARKKGIAITPVDSEHSAIWNLLRHIPADRVERIVLTASGGPFRNLKPGAFAKITVEDALNHPTWSMGAKVTVDSATLLNKGFEVIEAHHLFGFGFDAIDVIIHPESVVHSFVKGRDGSFYGQLGPADMRFPILSALSNGSPIRNTFPGIDLASVGRLSFAEPDRKRFPLLGLAYSTGRAGGVLPAVLAAADDVAVKKFLSREIGFPGISRLIRRAVDRFAGKNIPRPGITDILGVMEEVRLSLS